MKRALLGAAAVLFAANTTVGQHGSPLAYRGQQVEITKPAFDSECDAAAKAPAQLCLKPLQVCYTPPMNDPPFGFDAKVNVVHLGPTEDALLFTAVSSACGSGSLEVVALLDLQKDRLENLLPDVTISNQGQYKVWIEPTISTKPIFVTADYLWGDGESHFGRHRFRISTYVFGTEPPYYYLRDQYVTTRKYPSYDEADKITVLENERPEVLARLRRQKD